MFKAIAKVDKFILLPYLVLVFIGLFIVMDIATYQNFNKFFKQFIWIFISFGGLWLGLKMDLEKSKSWIFPMVILVFILLMVVLGFGNIVKGAKRSLSFGFISFQPSLLARITLIFYFSYILEKKRNINIKNLKSFFIEYKQLIIVTGTFFLLILIGRHLSILIILALTLLIMLLVAKIPFKIVANIFLVFAVLGFLVVGFGAKFRSDRVNVFKKYNLFINSRDISLNEGEDYSTRQSLIALTSGGFWGTKGRAKDFNLPEADTDYIFSVIGEQWGFLGGSFLIFLYLLIYIRSLKNIDRKRSLYLKLLGVGLLHNIIYNMLVHIGVCISFLPATGVTLPFVSYGGTSLLMNSFSIGVILNISKEDV